MASIINASSSGSGGIVQTADASGVLQLQSNGTAALTVDASANIGINTASPLTKLTVNAGGSAASTNWTWLVGNSLNPPAGCTYGLLVGGNLSGGNSETNLIYGQGLGASQCLTFGKWTGSAYTEQMRIASTGYITNTGNPAFFASGTSAAVAPALNAWTVVPGFSGGALSQKGGANFVASTTTFTAPVAGYYQFNGSVGFSVVNGSTTYIGIGKNATSSTAGEVNFSNATGSTVSWEACISTCVLLAQGDTVALVYYSTSSSSFINVRTQYFSGFLVG